jgi:hypothetical protein
MAHGVVGDGALVRDPPRDVGLWRSLGRRQGWGIRLANGTSRMDCRPPVRGKTSYPYATVP